MDLKLKISKIWMCCIILLISFSQSADIVTLQLDSIYNFTQPPNQKRQYLIKIVNEPRAGEKLFVTAQTPYNDPFQQPYIKITSSQNFTLMCDDEASSYTGICQIEEKQLKKDRQFTVEISCLVDCRYRLAAYTSKAYNLALGKSIELSAMATYGMAKQIMIQIPPNVQFSSIIILAELKNYDTATEGFSLLVNYGPNATTPSQSNYMNKGIPTFGHRLNTQITSDQIKSGDKIAVYLFLGINNTVQLSSVILDGADRMISVGSPLVDFSVNGQVKKYILDLSSNKQIDDKDILIKCIIYSGSPDIKVSFDQNFTDIKTQDNWLIDSSIAYLLTPALRKQKGYDGFIYIKVTSFFSASYYLQAIINSKPFIVLENEVMQLVKIQANQLQNFIYEDENYLEQVPQNGLVKYKTTIQMMDGSVEVGIRDCDSLMKGNSLQQCLITTFEQVKDPNVRKTFDNVQGEMKRYFSTYVITFDYNVTSCPKFGQGTHYQRYICDFHILFINSQKNGKQIYLGVQVSKYTQIRQLKQGITSRDSVTTQSSNFYSFQLHALQNITKLQIYTTVIQGDVAILMSKTKKYPQLTDIDWTSKDIQMSISGNMVIQGSDLKVGTYYISVYGYEISDYLIGIAVQRVKGSNDSSKNNTDVQVTQIRLIKGISQTFTMPQNKTLMKFILTPTIDNQSTLIKIQSLLGDVQFDVTQKQTSSFLCDGSTMIQLQDDYCSFTSKINTDYIIKVYGYDDQVQQFMISYSDDNICQTYPINFPLYIELDPADKDGDWECFQYTLYTLKDIEITIAMSEFDKIRTKDILNVNINFGDGDKIINMVGHEYVIGKTELESYCKKSDASTTNDGYFNDKTVACQFQLKVSVNTSNESSSSSGSTSVEIMIAVQGFDDENVLFDGIPAKIVSKSLSTTVSKQFFYFIYDADEAHDLTIYLTSQTQSQYQVSARVISDSAYAKDKNGSQYPTFNSPSLDTYSVNSSYLSPITILNIPKEKITFGANQQNIIKVVLISVYGLSSAASQLYIFRVQATQSTTYLQFGETKIGYVDKDQLYEYEIELQSSIPSLISVRTLGVAKCIQTYMETKQYVKEQGKEGRNQTITVQFTDIKSFNTEKGTRKIIVKGTTQQVCTFQISYNSIGSSLKTIIKSVPYQISIQTSGGISYYLYNHKQDESFMVVQMVDAGNGIVYIQSLPNNSNSTVEQIMNKNLQQYKYVGQQNANVFINKSLPGYCTKCYYIIAVRGKMNIYGELVISMESQPIPLKEGSIVKDKLAESKSNKYQFYSSSTFNIKINLIYGRANVTIKTPANQYITKNNLANSVQIAVPVVSSNKNNIDYFDPNSRYLITVTGLKDASYFIGIGKKNQALRIFQGMPIVLQIKGTETSVQFTNVDDETPINLLVEDLGYDKYNDNNIGFSVSQLLADGSLGPPNAIKNQTKSEGSYNIEVKQKRADFNMKITPQRPTNISIIYAKMSFTHLVAGRSIMLTNPSIFQIFSPGDSIMIEIFSCKGDIEIIASSNYTKITQQDNQGIVRMQHANYGGHYVISAQNLKGEYFVLTKPLTQSVNQPSQLSYIISYYLYSAQLKQKMPYKALGIRNTNIQYSYKKGSIDFRLNKVYAKDNTKFNGKVVYNLYISNETNAITQMTKCALGTVYTVTDTYEGATIQPSDIRDYVTFSFKNQDIKKIIGSSPYYFVGAEASVTWDNSKPHHVKGAYFTYGISQLLVNNEPEFTQINRNTNFVVLWIVVPFLLGAVVLYLAARYFIRSLRYQPTQLIEEQEYGPSHEQFGSGKIQSSNGSQKKTEQNQEGIAHDPNKYAIQ